MQVSKTISIITSRLKINPMTTEKLQQLINQYKEIVPELSNAYQEMLDNCISYPEEFVWYTAWEICLNDSNTVVGYLGFKGFNQGKPEIGYGINEEYEGKGFATEAVNGICKWAFENSGVIAIEAEIDSTNTASANVLIKNGFTQTGIIGNEGPRYVKPNIKK